MIAGLTQNSKRASILTDCHSNYRQALSFCLISFITRCRKLTRLSLKDIFVNKQELQPTFFRQFWPTLVRNKMSRNVQYTPTTSQCANKLLPFQNRVNCEVIDLYNSERRYLNTTVHYLVLDENNELNCKSICNHNRELNNTTEINANFSNVI